MKECGLEDKRAGLTLVGGRQVNMAPGSRPLLPCSILSSKNLLGPLLTHVVLAVMAAQPLHSGTGSFQDIAPTFVALPPRLSMRMLRVLPLEHLVHVCAIEEMNG